MIAYFLAALTLLSFPFAVAAAVRTARGAVRRELSARGHDETERIVQLERAVASLTASVDRIDEGQQFLTRLLDKRASR